MAFEKKHLRSQSRWKGPRNPIWRPHVCAKTSCYVQKMCNL